MRQVPTGSVRRPISWDVTLLGANHREHQSYTLVLTGRWGDHSGAQRYAEVSSEPPERWKRVLNNPVRKAWCRRDLRWIGRERLEVMGYDLDVLIAELDALPTSYRRICSDVGAAVGSYCAICRSPTFSGRSSPSSRNGTVSTCTDNGPEEQGGSIP
jgi:hypothetical protein